MQAACNRARSHTRPAPGCGIRTIRSDENHGVSAARHIKASTPVWLVSTAPVAMSSSISTTDEAVGEKLKDDTNFSNDFSQFDFHKHWYPIAVQEFLDPKKPHPVQLLGKDLVIWKDMRSGAWNVFDDACPHRLVPLSEGRVEPDGTILCAYHRFLSQQMLDQLSSVWTPPSQLLSQESSLSSTVCPPPIKVPPMQQRLLVSTPFFSGGALRSSAFARRFCFLLSPVASIVACLKAVLPVLCSRFLLPRSVLLPLPGMPDASEV